MKYYFKGPLIDLEYIGKSEHKLSTATYICDSLTEEELSKIKAGYTISVVDDNIVLTDDSGIQLAEKDIECEQAILNRYSITDQLNCERCGSVEEKQTMNHFINAMRAELQNEGANADYSDLDALLIKYPADTVVTVFTENK